MGVMLKPTETEGFRATRLPHPWATIEQGRVIACNSVTPMTSQLPGFVQAKITYDVRSADGTVTLIDRNSTIFGEIAHGLAAGQDRLFVLWRSILTPPPDLVRITLNSPAADELGEAGMPGDIDQHVWKKIGGALLLSGADAVLEGVGAGLGSMLSKGNNNSTTSNLNFYQFQSQGQGLASALMSHTIEIPDTLHRDQALPCSIFVSGDLDFSSVYQLRRRP
jgi:type IV secretion system protein VirB10